jgi:hypothetical protein
MFGSPGEVRSVLVLLTKIIDLAPGGRERVLDRDFGVLVPFVILRGVADHDVVLGRHRQQDMDLETCPVPMVVARPNHGHPAGSNATIVRLEPLELSLNARPNWIRWLASLERDLKGNLHLSLSLSSISRHRE